MSQPVPSAPRTRRRGGDRIAQAMLATVLITTVIVGVGMAGPIGASHGTGSISGTILRENGTAFSPGVAINVFPIGGGTAHVTLTGMGGAYTVPGLGPGDYIVSYFWGAGTGPAAGNLFHREVFDESLAVRGGTLVSLTAGQHVTGIDGVLDEEQLCYDANTSQGPFPDVVHHTSEQFCGAIDWLERAGIATGYADGTFRPGIGMTRQAMAAYLFRYLGDPGFVPPGTATFSDVAPSHQFFKEIEWMATQGISDGFDDGTYRPNQLISRQAMAAFMYRMAEEPAFSPPGTPTFSDVGSGHQFFLEIEWGSASSVIDGYADDTFRPGNRTTRRAMASFLEGWDSSAHVFWPA
jgi:hypothetical protein